MLLEVMLAVAIMLSGLVAITYAFHHSLRIGQASREHYQAALLLEGRMWELEKKGSPEAVPTETALDNATWDVGETEEQGFQRWDLSLKWGNQQQQELTLSAYRP